MIKDETQGWVMEYNNYYLLVNIDISPLKFGVK